MKKTHPPLDSFSKCTKLPCPSLLVDVVPGTQSVSERIVFTRAGVMVLGQKLMSEVSWPV